MPPLSEKEETVTEWLLSMRHITKRFPGVTALPGFSLDVRAGEVHALVGKMEQESPH